MNGMDGNNHYEGSLQFSGWARNGRTPTHADLAPEASAFREYAQSQATLALAYEQRTANLIAAAHLAVAIDGPSTDVSKDLYEIDTRLGRNEGATK